MPDTGFTPEEVAKLYLATFAARTDAYADFWRGDPDPEKWHWVAVREELTVPRVLDGLRNGHPISTYMESAEGTTHLGAIDFDRDDGLALGQAIGRKIKDAGGEPMLERSRRGCHLWVVLDRVLKGDTVRLGLRAFVAEVSPYLARDRKVEILPKKFTRVADSLGAPLRMPMMAHQRTGSRYPLTDLDLAPIGASVSECMLAIPSTPARVLEDAALRARTPASEARKPKWMKGPSREAGDVVEILIAAGVDRVIPGRAVKCPLHADEHPSLSISRDGERVWCKNPECVGYNNNRGLGADQLIAALGGVHG